MRVELKGNPSGFLNVPISYDPKGLVKAADLEESDLCRIAYLAVGEHGEALTQRAAIHMKAGEVVQQCGSEQLVYKV